MYDRYGRISLFGEFPQGNSGYMKGSSMYDADNNRPIYNSDIIQDCRLRAGTVCRHIEEVTKREQHFPHGVMDRKTPAAYFNELKPGEDIGLEILPMLIILT
jgi:hypothetical protein